LVKRGGERSGVIARQADVEIKVSKLAAFRDASVQLRLPFVRFLGRGTNSAVLGWWGRSLSHQH